MARKLHLKALILTINTSDEESDSVAKTRLPERRRRALKSGNVCTVDSVVKKVTWLHTPLGLPAVYDELSVTLFVTRYLAVMDSQTFTEADYEQASQRTDGRCHDLWMATSL